MEGPLVWLLRPYVMLQIKEITEVLAFSYVCVTDRRILTIVNHVC